MALEIQSGRLERLGLELARGAGKSFSELLSAALDVEPSHPDRTRTWAEFRTGIEQIQAEIAALPVLDERSADEIIGYDENGLPR